MLPPLPAVMSPEHIPELAADPFADWVFREPRQGAASVAGLNDHALANLLAQFRRLHPPADTAARNSRPRRLAEPAALVVSPQPGYGKSHLIGRLFAALEGRATLIYVAPFQSPSLCWQSVLLRMVQELTFPDRQNTDAVLPPGIEPPTQLDAFAHGVLAHLLAGLIEHGRVEHSDPAGAAAWLRDDPLGAFVLSDPSHPWSEWLRSTFEHFHHEMEMELRRAGLTLNSPGWLRVLFRYAASLPGDEVRALSLAWLSGQALEPAEGQLLGLRTGELTPADLPDQINELCWRRLLDFCQLAGFYRPFVLCFDQTEAYGHSPALARTFGTVIAQIHLLAAHQMTVVTANQVPWETTVAPTMETADKDRFVPLPLEGLNRAQAAELVRLRCAAHDVPADATHAFLDGGWLTEKFPTERNRMGIRQFLQGCSARWRQPDGTWHRVQPVNGSVPENGHAALPPPEPPPTPTLNQILDRYTGQIARQPKRLGFNPDVFRWLVEEAAAGQDDCTISLNADSPRGYLPVVWTVGETGGKVFFGFEPGDNWKRWRGILRDARTCCVPSKEQPDTFVGKAVFFRTSEQPPVPGSRWAIAAEFNEARASFLDVIELDASATAELYAARNLYLDAVAGDLPYAADEAQAFLAVELEPFWRRIRQAEPA